MTTFKYQNSTKPLTLKQQRFLAGYQKHGNATRAAREAGFSENHSAGAGHRLLHHPLVQAALKQAVPIPGDLDVAQLVDLPSGLQVSFSYKGRPVAPDIALAVSQAGGSPTELGIWKGGLAMFSLLSQDLDGR